MNKQQKIKYAIFAGSAALLVGIGLAVAFFTDAETKNNLVSIGKVSMELTENFTNGDTLVPGQKKTKAPKLTNDGKNDEYVFLEVRVPRENVQMVDASGALIDSDKKMQEIFKFLAEQDKIGENADGTDIKGTVQSLSGTCKNPSGADETLADTVFSYHNGGNSSEGWIHLYKWNSQENNTDYNIYLFGYNKKLLTETSTRTLFDEIQLKSFIDEQLTGITGGKKSEQIAIVAYGIQADNLDLQDTDGENLSEKAYLSSDDLKSIYQVVQKKAGD